MTAPVFVDTNVFLYAVDRADSKKQEVAQVWREELWKSRLGRTSFQVLHEFYANLSHKRPGSRRDARLEIRDLLAWRPIAINSSILEQGWKLQDRYGLSFWDSLIASAAKSLACRYLLTEDFHTGQDLDGVIIISPFSTDPTFLYSE